MMPLQENKHDFVLAGGGLQAGLLAMALSHHRPDARVLIIEREERLCGNHTWSCHENDILMNGFNWLDLLPLKRWPGYEVKFSDFNRQVNLAYCSLRSCDLEAALHDLARRGKLEIKTGLPVADLTAKSILTTKGESYFGDTVIDCRGLHHRPTGLRCGYQKFHGFEIELAEQDWPEPLPVVMDATVSQQNGFRFLYVLPLNPRRVLIEDTHFSNDRELDRDQSFDELTRYLRNHQIRHWSIVREEQGCLPMPYSDHMQPSLTSPLRGGYAAGWFHAATGYSFPLAARFAEAVATGDAGQIPRRIAGLVQQNWFPARFSRLLNRMLFCLVSPEQRWTIFRRFYRVLSDETIKRFYAHQFTPFDSLRIVVGRPPRGLTPIRFFQSFKGNPCPVSPN